MTIARNSCFDAFEGMMPLEEALGRLKAAVGPIDRVETLPLSEAGGRVLAEDVISPMDVPPHNNAAVDGYAVFHEDLMPGGETRLPVTGRVAAGHALSRMPRKGEALRIFTGAPVPEGPDTIIMQEDAQEENGDVLLNPGVKRGANLRSAGEDIQVGATILRTGHLIRPQDVGYVASVGRADVRVYSRPRVAVFSTGDEVLEPGQRLTPGGIYDANRFAIAAVLRGMGCVVTDLGILPDSLEIIAKALGNAALEHDLIITSGGVSMGDEDHVKAAVESQGALHFWRVAIKPGRPIALGQVADTPFIGLPGNPVAALVTFLRMGRMLVARLAGRRQVDPQFFPVRAGFTMKKKAGRREWLRVRLEETDTGLVARKFAAQGSGILTSMVEGDGLVELVENVSQIQEGDPLPFLPFNEVLT